MRRPPPKKRAGVPTGPRRLDALRLDVSTVARDFGGTEKGVRAQVARGMLPYHRHGSRIFFLRSELDAYFARLPGVSVDEALKNVRARGES
jgi:hypothetical protein